MAAADFVDAVQKVYIAYYGRAADPTGLAYWSDQLDKARGNTAQIIQAFGTSDEARTLFGPGSVESKINRIYQQVLGRDADFTGLTFYAQGVTFGRFTLVDVAQRILDGVRGDDVATVANKLNAAKAYTAGIDTTPELVAYSGEAAAASAREFLSTVRDVAATPDKVAGAIESMVRIAESTSAVPNLTGNVDTVVANRIVSDLVYSPGGNDRINSLQDEDNLTGIGTNPTFTVSLGNTNDNGSQTITPRLNGIETINVSYTSTDGTGLDLQDSVGLKTLNVTRVSQALNDGAVETLTGNASARALNMPGSVTALSIANSSQYNDINLSYRIGALKEEGRVTAVLSNVLAQDMRIGEQRVEGFAPEYHVNSLKLDVSNNSTIQRLHLGGAGPTETDNQILSIAATGGSITIGGDPNANGNVIEHNAGLNEDGRLEQIEVTGTTAGRNVILGEVGQRKGFKLAGGGAAANIHVNITDAAGVATGGSTASFITGSGADTILSRDGLAGSVATGSGNDTVTLSGAGREVDGVISAGPGVLATTSTVNTGEGNDTVAVTGNLEGSTTGGAQVDLGAGNDRFDITGLAGEEASILGGDGDDVVTFTATGALATAIAGDSAGVEGEDRLGAGVILGGGADGLTFINRRVDDFVGVLVAGNVQGGAGEDILTVQGNASLFQPLRGKGGGFIDSNTNAANTPPEPGQDGFGVQDIETLTLISEEGYGPARVASTPGADLVKINRTKEDRANTVVQQTDANDTTADYVLNLAQFNRALATINLHHRDGVVVNRGPEEVFLSAYNGDDAVYTLANLTTEVINVNARETTAIRQALNLNDNAEVDILGSIYNDGGFGADVTLNLTRETAGGQTIVLEGVSVDPVPGGRLSAVANAAGVVNYDLAINDNDLEASINSLTLTVNSNNTHHVDLSNDFATALTVNGAGAGASANLTLVKVNAATINTAAYAGNVYVGVESGVAHTVTTGGGNDVVRLGDRSTPNNTPIALGVDSVNAGAGTDAVVLNGTGTTAGLTSLDTLAGGDGSDTLGFGGTGGLVVPPTGAGIANAVRLAQSEFTNVRGFETLRLGVGLGLDSGVREAPGVAAFVRSSGQSALRYDLELNDSTIAANAERAPAGFFRLNVVNDAASLAGTAVSVLGTSLDHNVDYRGNDTRQDRLLVDDRSQEGLDVFTGGAGPGGLSAGNLTFNDGDVLEVRGTNSVTGSTVVTVSDMANIAGVEELHFAAMLGTDQVLTLTLPAGSGIREVYALGAGVATSDGTGFRTVTGAGVARVILDATSYAAGQNLFVDGTRGGASADVIATGGGNDTIMAGPGNDTLDSGGGNDVLVFNAAQTNALPPGIPGVGSGTTDSVPVGTAPTRLGGDTVQSFSLTSDTIRIVATGVEVFNHAIDTDIGNAANGFASNVGLIDLDNADLGPAIEMDDGADTAITFTNPDGTFSKASFESRLQYNLGGNAGNNVLTAGDLADTLGGGIGDDSLGGGRGSDVLDGGAGSDMLVGGAGADVLTGGADSDTFVFSAAASTSIGGASSDDIIDLSVGDIIDLSQINGGLIAFNNGTRASSLSGAGITFTAGYDVFVGAVGGQEYLFYEITSQGILPTDAGFLEVVGIDIVGTLVNWTEAGGLITVNA